MRLTKEQKRLRHNLAARVWRARNPDKHKLSLRSSYLKNKEKRLLNAKKYRDIHKEEGKLSDKLYRDKNKEKAKEYAKQYRRNNGKELYSKRKNKIKSSPLLMLTELIRRKTKYIFRKKKLKKYLTSETLLGCTYEEARKHIEEQFLPGMTWENRGKNGWEVDHIIPLILGSTSEELSYLCKIQNLRPLWSADNKAKSDSMPETMFYI